MAEQNQTSEDTQNSEQPEEVAEDQEEQWLEPGRFRTAEDLRKAYTELENKLSAQGEELGQYRQAVAAMAQSRGQNSDEEDEDDEASDDDFVTVAQAKKLRAELRETRQLVDETRKGAGSSTVEVFRVLKASDPNHDVISARFEELVKAAPPERLGNIAALNQLWTYAAGLSVPDLVARGQELTRQEAVRQRQQQSRMGASGTSQGESGSGIRLNRQQKAAAKGLGITEEAFGKQLEAMVAEAAQPEEE